nr:signal peptidase I [Arthrobacter ulcerisalmonis]
MAGGLCLLAVLAGAVLNVSLVVFRTGSMSPGINPGDIAVVQEVPAASLQPGDVATVQREASALPVTHRVVANVTDPADPQKVLLTMKGDANESEDPVRYNVPTAKRLLFSAPALGYWVMRLQTPWLMGVCTLAMAALVTWIFWPRTSRGPRASMQADS